MLKISRYTEESDNKISFLKYAMLEYKDPTKPVGVDECDMVR